MDEQAKSFYELRFRNNFLESKAAAFQDLFAAIMSKAHPADFIPCRPWGNVGDRKNDGYLKSERTLFQVYAPNEMKAADAVAKIERDFAEALPYWRKYFDTWVFVHNSHGGLPPGVIAKLLEIEQAHTPIRITHWGFDELLLRFQRLSADALRSLYGSPPSRGEIRESRKQVLSPLLQNKHDQARTASRKRDIESALDLWEEVRQQAEAEGNKAEELNARLEVVLILARESSNLAEALKLADACLQEATSVELGADRSRLLQLLGEVHRIKGNRDQARGFLMSAIEHARSTASSLDEGVALLSLSGLEGSERGRADSAKALELIDLAYNAFSAAYASGNEGQQKSAKDGFAQCHTWRAEIFDHSRPDDALSEWTRALTLYRELGEGWELWTADTFLHRARLRAGLKEVELSASDLDHAAEIYHRLGYTIGLAKCYLQAGELADSIGERVKAADHYKQAGAIAATWGNDRRASYYYFRYACKLIELREYEQAEPILVWLAEADWLEREHKLTSIFQLCLIVKTTEDEEKLKKWCTIALALIDEAIDEAVLPEEWRSLLLRKGHLFVHLGMYDKALKLYRQAAERFESAKDQKGLVECWFQIRGVMQNRGDMRGEREASEKVLELGGERLSPMLAALTLVGLAQLNIKEQRYAEAREQLGRAIELNPDNPVVRMVERDLRGQLPQLYPTGPHNGVDLQRPTECGLAELIRELYEWCDHYPSKQKSILAVWYYIHRAELWSTFRSALGVKFLICTVQVDQFEHIKSSLCDHADLLAWGTNFSLETKEPRSPRGLERVPVPEGFLFPAGILVLSPARDTGSGKGESRGEGHLLGPAEELTPHPYYLAFMKKADNPRGIGPFFVGKRQVWRDLKVVRFMLGPPRRGSADTSTICLPLGEGGVMPNLKRILQVASENAAIPFFSGGLPHYDDVSAVCDSTLELPMGGAAVAKDLWDELLSTCSENPRPSLTRFSRGMAGLLTNELRGRLPVRVHLLRFLTGDRELVYPAVVVLKGTQARKRAGNSRQERGNRRRP
jgi:tetratricopeptide (TPR) repeat protein